MAIEKREVGDYFHECIINSSWACALDVPGTKTILITARTYL
jgi:hypothetical protein